jgi:hypothetical protein
LKQEIDGWKKKIQTSKNLKSGGWKKWMDGKKKSRDLQKIWRAGVEKKNEWIPKNFWMRIAFKLRISFLAEFCEWGSVFLFFLFFIHFFLTPMGSFWLLVISD